MPPAGDDPRGHAWWSYVPEADQGRRLRESRRRRLIWQLNRRPNRIIGLLALYSLIAALPLLFGAASLTWVSLLPLLLLPAIAGVAWWLTWKEFHH